MRHITRENISDAVVASFDKSDNERLKFLLSRLVAHLHGFAAETKLTHAEWQSAIGFLFRAGKISDARRNEFILLSDVLGLSSLVDLLQDAPGATMGSVLGPFHSRDSRELPVGADLIEQNTGDAVLVMGRVLDATDAPVAGAQIDFWQATSAGLYPQQDPGQHAQNLRMRMHTGTDGHYRFTTVRPAPYTVPDDGPVGELLRSGGRHAWRPAHFHFIVSADGFNPVVTELFPSDDPYLTEDAVFGVRDPLVVAFRRVASAEEAARHRIRAPFFSVEFDFRLTR